MSTWSAGVPGGGVPGGHAPSGDLSGGAPPSGGLSGGGGGPSGRGPSGGAERSAAGDGEPGYRVGKVTTIPGGGSWLRIALAVATLVTLAVIWVPGDGNGQESLELTVMAGVFLWLVARPGSVAAMVLLLGALVLRISPGVPELDGSLVALTVLLPLVHQLAALCVVVPLRANVQWPALLPTAVRYVGVVTATVLGLLASSLLGWW